MLPKTPLFWQHDGLIAKILSPASLAYLAGHKIKSVLSGAPYCSTIPVVCIGGVVAGGSGKTPTLHAVLDIIKSNTLFGKPVILTRGYGGTIKTATLVDPAAHTYHDVGDEALLHAAKAVTIVSPDRKSGAQLAEKIGADIILMDDGLQNNGLIKTASLLVVDSTQGFGNGRLLPAGPLREPLNDALDKTNMIVRIGGHSLDDHGKTSVAAELIPSKSFTGRTSYYAFAGIGHPEKFHRTLVNAGASLKGFVGFADHHPYTANDIEKLRKSAGTARLITTEKDFVRIPPEHRDNIDTLGIQIHFKDDARLQELLRGLQ